jgi:hypothetical protein
MAAKIGRRQKPYESALYGPVVGLARDTDGRWRIVATGQKYTEADEGRAIERFRRMTASPTPTVAVRIEAQSSGNQGPTLAAMNIIQRASEAKRCTPPRYRHQRQRHAHRIHRALDTMANFVVARPM